MGLLLLFGYQIFKALRYAAMNRILQRKVYLDEATGLPNKNKCEELLDAPDPPDGNTALCVFDLNNLRTINNNLGHDKGDEYIRAFAEQLRLAVPSQHFVGRDGGDEFIAILYGVDWDGAQDVLRSIRAQTAEYSRQHPEMPLRYAAGCAIASDFEGSTCGSCSATPTRICMWTKTAQSARRPRPRSCRTSSFCRGHCPWVSVLGLPLLRRPAGPVSRPAHLVGLLPC